MRIIPVDGPCNSIVKEFREKGTFLWIHHHHRVLFPDSLWRKRRGIKEVFNANYRVAQDAPQDEISLTQYPLHAVGWSVINQRRSYMAFGLAYCN